MSLTERISQALIVASRRGDLAIATIVLVAIVMMIVPLPTPLVDVLITANIAASVLILLIAFYIAEPLDLSALPSLVLLATLFRLAITISTARLILLQADAGEIISAFGSFVVGGNIAVGLVVFLIITVAQFVVITKGAERVAEVAARFTLDALPGRQMSIDGDLRGGDIDRIEARRQRGRLTQESHLYGAMDGAMKFVRGDAISSIIIIAINLIGGLAIGTMQHELSLSQAIETYSLLTVGDGLVAQIPALLVSVAAGTVVTRVGTIDKLDLGTEILQQMVGEPRALFLAGAILLALAWIPGFPWPAFVILAALFAAGGYVIYRRTASASTPAAAAPQVAGAHDQAALPQPGGATSVEATPARYRLAAIVGRELGQRVQVEHFNRETARVRQSLAADLGMDLPAIALRADDSLEPHHFRIELEGVPILDSAIPPDALLAESDAVDLELLAIPYAEGPRIGNRRPAMWVEQRYQPTLAAAGIEALVPVQVLALWLAYTLRRYATQFLGIQETREIVVRTEREYPELTKEAQKITTLQKIAEILRRLLDENVPVGNMRIILEAVVEWGPREQDTILLVEYVRIALRRQICFRCADRNRVIVAYMLERSVEETLRSAVRSSAAGAFLSLPDAATRPFVERIKRALAAAPDKSPVVLTSMDVRRHVRSILVRNDLDVAVLSYQELAPEFSVQPLAASVEAPHGESISVAAEAAE
ncbi:MAG: type III secretion system export apparatus subunit SctV [Alphaproteobacteria bacterium]|nr:type III secretion system export apparatus subunit SctV [Alphaproteobacteria bacterium]